MTGFSDSLRNRKARIGIPDDSESRSFSKIFFGGWVPGGCANADSVPINHRITSAHQITADACGVGLANGHLVDTGCVDGESDRWREKNRIQYSLRKRPRTQKQFSRIRRNSTQFRRPIWSPARKIVTIGPIQPSRNIALPPQPAIFGDAPDRTHAIFPADFLAGIVPAVLVVDRTFGKSKAAPGPPSGQLDFDSKPRLTQIRQDCFEVLVATLARAWKTQQNIASRNGQDDGGQDDLRSRVRQVSSCPTSSCPNAFLTPDS